MKKFALFLMLLTVMLVPLTTAMAQDEETVVISVSYDIVTLNPILATDGGSFNAIQFIYPDLYKVDPFTGELLPSLTEWEISDDGLVYTFYIREDAVWSDGTPITAQDIKFTYEAFMSDVVESPRKADVANVESIEVIDDKTVQFTLSQVDCTFLGGIVVNIVPAHKFAADFSDVNDSYMNSEPDISGGPYILKEWKADEYALFEANPDYYLGEPSVKYLINRVVSDPAVQNQMLLAGELDYAFMYPDEFKQLGSYDMFTYGSFALHNTPLFAMNWADPDNPQNAYDEDGNFIEQDPHPIFGDVLVRQAMVMGFSKDDLLATLDGEGTRNVASVIPTITWAFNTELEPWPYDPERAAQLLDEAGWIMNEETGIREKDGEPLAFEIAYSPGVTDLWDNIALIAQNQLSELGMEITLNPLEWGAFLDYILGQQFDAMVVGFGGGVPPDPDGIAGNIARSTNDVVGSGFNLTSYVNPEVDELLDQGKTVPGCDLNDRAIPYKEMQRILLEEVAYDFTVSPNQVHVWNSRVSGFELGPWWSTGHDPQAWTIGE